MSTTSDNLSEPDDQMARSVGQPVLGDRLARHDRLVEDAGLDSFPASDPPGWWAGLEPTPPVES
jgi:hypothetical protein